jgi:hypothetical protein
MFAAKQNQNQSLKMPRACPVETHVCCYLASNVKPRPKAVAPSFGLKVGVATIVKFHGTSPWHLFSTFVQSWLRG